MGGDRRLVEARRERAQPLRPLDPDGREARASGLPGPRPSEACLPPISSI